MRARRADARLVLFSALECAETIRDGKVAGADHVVFKPVRPHVLLRVLEDGVSDELFALPHDMTIARAKKEAVCAAVVACKGNITHAARMLAISRQAVQQWIARAV